MTPTDPTATTLQSGAVISDLSKGGTGNVITPVDNSTLQQSSPITVPPTQITDPNAALVNSTNADLLNAQSGANTQENQRNTDLSQYQTLSNQLLGKSADQLAAEQANGLPDYQKQLLDLQNTAKQQTLEYNLAPTTTTTGYGVSTSNMYNTAVSARQKDLAIQNMRTNINIQSMQGNIAQAQALADKAVKIKYDPIEQQLQTQKDIIAAHYQDLTASQKKLADAKSVQLDMQTKQIANQKEDMKTILGWGALAGKNGASALQVQAIQNATDLKTAANLFAPFSQDPMALQKAVNDLAIQRADINYKNAQTNNLNATAGKTAATTPGNQVQGAIATTNLSPYNNVPKDVAPYYNTSHSGVAWADLTTMEGNATQKKAIVDQAQSAGIKVITNKNTAADLVNIGDANGKLDTIGTIMAGIDQPGWLSRFLYGAGMTKLAQMAQSNPQQAAAGALEGVGLDILKAISGVQGFRGNSSVVAMITAHLPSVYDTNATVQSKIEFIRNLITNREDAILGSRGNNAGSTTGKLPDGTTVTKNADGTITDKAGNKYDANGNKLK